MNFFGTRVKDIMFRTESKQMMSPVWLQYTILEKLLHAMNKNKENLISVNLYPILEAK